MEYVFPVPPWLRGELLEYKRLYAFPAVPEENPFILDSGAFALFKRKQRMDEAYFEKLYLYYSGSAGWKSAPDVLFNPKQTMFNFKNWFKKYPDCRVCPVIQMRSKKIETALSFFQLDFYKELIGKIKFLFIANPFLRSSGYPDDFFKKIKERSGAGHVHLFGAGWDIQDIRGYSNFQCLDSIDSIAFYNAVNTTFGNWAQKKGGRVEKALGNVKYVQRYCF